MEYARVHVFTKLIYFFYQSVVRQTSTIIQLMENTFPIENRKQINEQKEREILHKDSSNAC